MPTAVEVRDLKAWYGKTEALHGINIAMDANHATALIGPSGCGKSTFIRCLNRMHETNPIARAEGEVKVGEQDIYAMPAVEVRRKVGMVFQKANPFPSMSIYDNVGAGLKLNGTSDRKTLDEAVERSLQQAALWDEVKDVLKKKSGASLSKEEIRRQPFRRPATTPVYRPGAGGEPGSASHGRTVLRPRSHFHGQNRGPDF